MENIPWHPAVVHLPIGIAIILPLAALGIWIGIIRGYWPSRAWLLVIALNALLVGSAFLALKTGEHEEERVEEVVSENAIEKHEEAGERFLLLSGVALALTGAAYFIRKKPWENSAKALATFGLAALVFAAYHTGKSGGQLVYRYGAGQAYTQANPGGFDSHGDQGEKSERNDAEENEAEEDD